MKNEKQIGTMVVSTNQMETIHTGSDDTPVEPTGYICVRGPRMTNRPPDHEENERELAEILFMRLAQEIFYDSRELSDLERENAIAIILRALRLAYRRGLQDPAAKHREQRYETEKPCVLTDDNKI